ncbi:hypothetical protein KP509_11G032800 [Ceratopteris richardii]|uniref:EF-hand domain-containing protein n=1 Tax=Ceratopteris richardii TaxID=49495 RepID=A0A8T2TNM2_CERRI|nr:hypothetical protein KP509_11G032800 [Ceratopteris richardii]
MPVVVIDRSTVLDFVQDAESFDKAMERKFYSIDVNHDGSLSRAEVRAAFECVHVLECTLGMPDAKSPRQLNKIYDSIFERFDTDHNGVVDMEEFRAQMRDILLAVAHGLGSAPLQIATEEDGFLQDAANHELEKNSAA